MSAFQKFYSNLYKEKEIDEKGLEDYMLKIDFRKSTKEERNMLDDSITQEEIRKVIEQMKLGKAPGPDGFTAKLYKFFKEEMVQRIQIAANNILEGENPPKIWQVTTILMIPKE